MNQSRSFAETASDAWVRCRVSKSMYRARRQAGAFEFHCGNPPPAAEPRTMILNPPRPARDVPEGLLYLGAGVGVDFEADRDLDDPRLHPFFHADLRGSPCRPIKLGRRSPAVNASAASASARLRAETPGIRKSIKVNRKDEFLWVYAGLVRLSSGFLGNKAAGFVFNARSNLAAARRASMGREVGEGNPGCCGQACCRREHLRCSWRAGASCRSFRRGRRSCSG